MSRQALRLVADADGPVSGDGREARDGARAAPRLPRAGDREFLPEAVMLLDAPASPVALAMNLAVCGTLAAALAWACVGRVDVYAETTARLQAPGRTQVIEPAEGGTVTAILARDGEHVRRGQAILELEAGPAVAAEAAARAALATARAEVARRRAAIDAAGRDRVDPATPVAWPADLPADVRAREALGLGADLAALASTLKALSSQRAEAVAQRDRAQAAIPPQRRILDLLHEHSGMREATFKQGWDSRATQIQTLQQEEAARLAMVQAEGSLGAAEAAVPVLDDQAASARKSFQATNAAALSQAEGSLESLALGVAKAALSAAHMTLRAPLDGTVAASAVTTLGQVLQPGAQVAQVVPDEGTLEFEGYVSNRDIGFLRVGQDAIIKVDTFPYTRYGTLSGKVTHVARDALTGAQARARQGDGTAAPGGQDSATSASQQTSDLVFPVTVRPDRAAIDVDGRPVRLTPGMTATLDVATESRTVIDYVLSPLRDTVAGAAHER